MHAPTLPARSLLTYLTRRGVRSAADRDVQHELSVKAEATLTGVLPPGLEITWLGTAGFRLRHGDHTLLIDPYLTRMPLGRVLARSPALSDRRRVAAHLDLSPGAVDAILVGHAHFDHALDVPLIARATSAPVYGSRSTAALLALHNLAERAIEVTPHRTYAIGPFEVSFVPSAHARLLMGVAVPMSGDITCDTLGGLRATAYHCGQVFGIHIRVAGASIYHLGSAELDDDATLPHPVDLLLSCIAGRSFSRHYFERALRRLQPRALVPHHHDDFFRPLDAPMEMSFNVDLAGAVDELGRIDRALPVATLPPGTPIRT